MEFDKNIIEILNRCFYWLIKMNKFYSYFHLMQLLYIKIGKIIKFFNIIWIMKMYYDILKIHHFLVEFVIASCFSFLKSKKNVYRAKSKMLRIVKNIQQELLVLYNFISILLQILI